MRASRAAFEAELQTIMIIIVVVQILAETVYLASLPKLDEPFSWTDHPTSQIGAHLMRCL